MFPPTANGFRLARDLEALLTGLPVDGRISAADAEHLRHWIDASQALHAVRPFAEWGPYVVRAIADGRLDGQEIDDLLFVCHRFTTGDPYLAACCAGVQALRVLLDNLSATRAMTRAERARLRRWMATWSPICDVWPLSGCDQVVRRALDERRISGDETGLREIAERFAEVPPALGARRVPLTVRRVCDRAPALAFIGRRFVFVGETARTPRPVIAQYLRVHGALLEDQVHVAIDFVVVGARSHPAWAFSLYGRVLEQAMTLRGAGHPVRIVLEDDFWAARA